MFCDEIYKNYKFTKFNNASIVEKAKLFINFLYIMKRLAIKYDLHPKDEKLIRYCEVLSSYNISQSELETTVEDLVRKINTWPSLIAIKDHISKMI